MKPLSSPRCVVALCLALFAVAPRALAAAAAAAAPTDPAAAPAREPGWMNRLAAAPGKLAFWKKDDAPAVAPVAPPSPEPKPAKPSAKTAAKEKLGPATPEASKKIAATKSKATPATEPAAATKTKPSLWSRMGSAVLPGKTEKPTAPVRKSHPLATAEPNSSTFVITKDESPFYTFGPHQATAPDAYLSTGTVVTVQEKSWGWAQVQLPDGRSGTIARNALRPATAVDLVPASLPHSLMAAATPRRRVSADSYVMPPAAMPDLPTGPASPDTAAEAEELSSALLPPFVE